MTRLEPFAFELDRAARRRLAARWAIAAAQIALGVLAAAACLFLLDWLFDLEPLPRLAALVMAISLVVACTAAWCRPIVGRRERPIELALELQRQQHIDSDLVAALEFDRRGAPVGASPQLAGALVDYVAEYASHVNVGQALPPRSLRRPAAALFAGSGIVLLAAIVFPSHLRAFAGRLLLRPVHYPVKTHIEQVQINRTPLALDGWSVRSPFGRPCRFELRASGELPENASVELRAPSDGSCTRIVLSAVADTPGTYVGRLPRLVESVGCQFFAGDDWTEPGRLEAIALPVVNVSLDVVPPAYVAAQSSTDAQTGSRQVSVVEGTRVGLQIECANKPLERAMVMIGEQTYPLLPADSARRRWRLDAAGTPLASVVEPLHYRMQVVDADGLELAEPIDGFIRLKSDRPPRVTAALVTQYVLPTGKPHITYGAVDDYGIAELRLSVQHLHEDGSTSERLLPIEAAAAPQKVYQGRYLLDLSKLDLVKGDQLKLLFEARDHRGDRPGQWSIGEPLVLHVTDERGVLAAMAETDQRSARQLELIIQRQLGIGD